MLKKILVCILFIAIYASAQNTPYIKRIEYHNIGTGTIDKEYIKAYTSVRTGYEFDRIAVARDIKALLKTGLFSNIEVKTRMDGSEMVLEYYFTNKYRLAEKPKITGNKKFSRRKLTKLLDLDQEDLIDDQVLATLTKKIEQEYRKNHYPNAEVSWNIEVLNEDTGAAKVSVHIKEGTKEYIKFVYFEGNSSISDSELDKVIRFPVWWNPLDWFRKITPDAIELDTYRQLIREQYLNRGYLDVSVSPAMLTRNKKGELTASYQIQEGEMYQFGNIKVTGITIFPQSVIDQVVIAEPGHPASVTVAKQTRDNIEDYYGQRGYLNTRVKPIYFPSDKQHVVDIQYDVSEGHLTKIHDIIIKGNVRTKDKVIRRELLVNPGDIYDTIRLRRSENRLRNLGFFDLVRTNHRTTEIPDEQDMVIEVRETKTGNIMLGAGFSSIDKLTGFLEFSQANFDLFNWPYMTGGGQKLKVKLQLGTTRNEFNVSFVEPWFLNKKLSLGTDVFWLDYEYDEYYLERVGTAISLTQPLFGPARITYSLALQDEDVTETSTNQYWFVDNPTESYYFTDQNFFKTTVGTTISYDTRNHPFAPSRGDKIKLFLKYSGGIFGGDEDTYNIGMSYRKYLPLWFDHVLSIRLEGEVIDNFNGPDDEIPLSDRLYIGGGRTIRGYEYRNVGPKVKTPQDGEPEEVEPIGGCTSAMLSIEYTIPIINAISIAGFYDMGNVWYDPFEFSSNYASSAGIGIRLNMPGFPIRIDYAVPIHKDSEYTEEEPWNFWIGYDI